MTTPTIRDRLRRLADDVFYLLGCIRDGSPDAFALEECRDDANTARDLLAAETVGEGPSELELEEIELKLWERHRIKGWGGNEFMYDNNFSFALQEYRAILARWGRPAAPPAALAGEVGEVGELSPKEVEAQDAFTQMRDEILNLSDGVDVNEVLGIIDSHTPEWV